MVRKALEGSPLEGMHYTFNCIMITLTLKNLFNLHFFNYPKSRVKLLPEAFPIEENAFKLFDFSRHLFPFLKCLIQMMVAKSFFCILYSLF